MKLAALLLTTPGSSSQHHQIEKVRLQRVKNIAALVEMVGVGECEAKVNGCRLSPERHIQHCHIAAHTMGGEGPSHLFVVCVLLTWGGL